MDNPELILQSLEHFIKLKDEAEYLIPMELEEYIHYVAKTGDPVFQWTLVKPLFREKIIKVVTEFFESTPGEIPDYPNVNKFNYDTMKSTLLERIDWFKGAPFTIQRISELLVNPTKEYNRVDKYMRALEKNIYVVSTREPGMPQPAEENTTFEESFILNGNDFELKSENSEMHGSKEEEDEANALLLLKKCSNNETDDVNFNIEVDVTNTPSEDAQGDGNMEGAEINVHDEIADSSDTPEETLNVGDEKCGQTRKLEEDENSEVENEPKRFKMDEGETYDEDNIKDNDVVTEEVLTNEVEMNIEESSKEEETPDANDSNNVSQEEQATESKSDIEMELEETVDSKIESFDNIETAKNDTSLNVTDNDSMVISQDSSISEDNVEKSVEENIDGVVSESSDMDLSDGVANPELKTSEISELLDLPESNETNVSSKSSDNVEADAMVLEDKQEDVPTSSNDIANDTPIVDSTTTSVQAETTSEAEDGLKNEAVESSTAIVSESIPSEPILEEESTNDEPTPSSATDEVPVTKEEDEVSTNEVEAASTEQATSDINESKEEIDTTEEAVVESTSETSPPEIEEAILHEDEFELEEVGSSVDPLATETDESEQVPGEVELSSVEDKPSGASGDASSPTPEIESTTEQNVE